MLGAICCSVSYVGLAITDSVGWIADIPGHGGLALGRLSCVMVGDCAATDPINDSDAVISAYRYGSLTANETDGALGAMMFEMTFVGRPMPDPAAFEVGMYRPYLYYGS